jgi:indolepyruvate decarboxylase
VVTIAEFLLSRLKGLGVDHVFGIPGDYILPFFEAMVVSDVEHVATCNELNAGYAADGYARLRGLGAVAVTYGPGAFSLVNATAGAYAERVPMVVISGGPPSEAYRSRPHLHHVLPDRYEVSLRIFEQITVAAKVLDDAARAANDVDELLQRCLSERRPVYLEIAQDVQQQAVSRVTDQLPETVRSGNPAATAAAVESLVSKMQAASSCVLLVGHEINTPDLRIAVQSLVDKTGVPVASVFTGKPDFLEHHPRCIGIYHGLGSPAPVREFVEGADAVVWFGAVASDFNMGGSSANLSDDRTMHVFDGQVKTSDGTFTGVPVDDVIERLLAILPEGHWADLDVPLQEFAHTARQPFEPVADTPISNKRFYDRIAHFLAPGDVVLADAGPSISMAHLQLPPDTRYLSSSYWASIGAGFGFTVGACFAARPGQRVIALEGDGAFQMTGQEVSTMVRYERSPIIFILNNRGYTAERLIHDGPFNDIQDWDYHRLPEAFGGVAGEDVHTEGDLEAALERAETHTGPGPLLIEVHLDPLDVSEAFVRMSEGLRSR